MKKILPSFITAAVLLAGCSSTHTLTQNNSKEDEIIAERNAQVQKDFVYNLILLARCNPQLVDNYAYMYDVNSPYFYSLYFTPFNNLQFTPHKLYLSYDASYSVRNYAINEYTSQYANPYTPAPAGFQKNTQVANNKGLQPVPIARGYNYVQGGNIDHATSNRLNNNYASQNNSNNSNNRGYANSAASKYENVTQPQKTYTPAYGDNNNNAYQANSNNQSTGSQANNNNANNGTKTVLRRD